MGIEVKTLKMNSQNEMTDYLKINSQLEKYLQQRPVRTREKQNSKITTPGSKPIDKKDFMDGVQQEIHVASSFPDFHYY